MHILAAVAILAQVSYPIRTIPVSWPNGPSLYDKTSGLALCQDTAAKWSAMTKGRVAISCAADDPHVFSEPFVPPASVAEQPGRCFQDWTGAIAGASGSGEWPIYLYAPPGCPSYNANFGRPGAWLQSGLLLHEFGHNLGLNHTGDLECYGYPFDPNPSTTQCKASGYSKDLDVMGTGGPSLNAPHALHFGVPPAPVALVRGPQSVDLAAGPVNIPRGDGLVRFWLEAWNGAVFVEYDGWIPYAATDVFVVARLGQGQSFTDVYAGNRFTRGPGLTVQIEILPPQAPPTAVPTPVPGSPTPSGRCFFGFTEVACTPTPASTASATATPASTPTGTPAPPPTRAATIAPTLAPLPPTATETPVPATETPIPIVAPTRPPAPKSGGCGGGQAALLLFLPALLLPFRPKGS